MTSEKQEVLKGFGEVRNGSPMGQEEHTNAGDESALISIRQNSSSPQRKKRVLKGTVELRKEGVKDTHLFQDTSSTTEKQKSQLDNIPSHGTHHNDQCNDNNELFHDWALCSRSLDEPETIRFPVEETSAVKEDPSIKLLRQRIQKEQKHESCFEIGQLEVTHQGGSMAVSDPNNLALHYNREQDSLQESKWDPETEKHSPLTHKPSFGVANSSERVAQDTKAKVSSDKVSSSNENDLPYQCYQEHGDGHWTSIFLMCDDSMSDWANYNSLQYQFV